MITETGIAYAINIVDDGITEGGDIPIIHSALADAGIAIMGGNRESEPYTRLYVDSARIMEAVDVINGLGYTTDEDRDEDAE